MSSLVIAIGFIAGLIIGAGVSVYLITVGALPLTAAVAGVLVAFVIMAIPILLS